MQTDKRKERKLDKNCLYYPSFRNIVVELYTLLVLGDAFFLQIERSRNEQNNKQISTMTELHPTVT